MASLDETRLEPLLQAIDTREDLVRYIQALRDDLLSHSDRWENPTLERFLEALGAWISDSSPDALASASSDADPIWKNFGLMLSAARIYE